MEWLYSLFIEHSALQAVVVLSLISAIGLGLGKIHVCGISLGVTFVFFAGILAGHFGLSIDPQMLNYADHSERIGHGTSQSWCTAFKPHLFQRLLGCSQSRSDRGDYGSSVDP